MSFKKRFIGDSDEFSLDHRIFHVVCLILFLASFTGAIVNLMIDIPLAIVALIFIFSLTPILLYYLSRYKKRFALAQSLLLIVGYSFIALIWFYSEGISGYVHLIVFSIIIWQMVFTRHNRYIWFLINLAFVTILALAELFHPEWVKWHYSSLNDKILDFLFTYIIMGASTFFVVRVLIINYKKEKHAVEVANLELEAVNQKLNSTIAELESTNQTKNKLFSIISHDIRSIAGPIAGLSEVLYTGENNASENMDRKIISSINESSKNLNSLLENLLSWARIQMHSDQANPVQFNLTELVSEVIDLFQPNIKHKQQLLIFNEESAHQVFADIEMTKSIIRNLLSNAIKFSQNGGKIEVSIDSNTTKDMVDLCVADNGIGMTEKEIQQMTQPDNFFTRQGTNFEKGTGLGFLICQEFAEKNNGGIKVKSKPRDGSSFTLSLPKR